MRVIPPGEALPDSFDVAVIGAGGAGLAAALFAALEGLQVLLVERTGCVGGTTAYSAGTTWIPGTHHAKAVNPHDSLADAARYLDLAVGSHAPVALREAFLNHGPQAVECLEARSAVKFRPYAKHPDYLSELDGATLNGRALEPLPFDGRLLGDLFQRLRPPIPEFTVLGGMMVDRNDISHLLAMTRSWASFRHAARLIGRHALDRLRHPRGTRLVMGNALVARLLFSLTKHAGVSLMFDASVEDIGRGAAGIESIEVLCGGRRQRVRVRRGVVLASGGFNRHAQRRSDWLPGANSQWCPGAPGHTGAAQDLAVRAGARFGAGAASHALWAPVSLRRRVDGSHAVFPHFVMDRAKPGMLTVDQAGTRFVNESTSYHLFALAMRQRPVRVPAYLVCDATALKRYGLGMVRPGGKGLAPFIADGYLTEGRTLDELAGRLGIDAAGLKASVAAMNAYARSGVDADFARGTTAYQHNIGDASLGGRNPNLGPIETAPFYAVRLYPGDIGAATGLATNDDAQVLGEGGAPIAGLYAVGNDMQSIMGGVYTAPGITIGPGLVFAYLAVRHLSGRVESSRPVADSQGASPVGAEPALSH